MWSNMAFIMWLTSMPGTSTWKMLTLKLISCMLLLAVCGMPPLKRNSWQTIPNYVVRSLPHDPCSNCVYTIPYPPSSSSRSSFMVSITLPWVTEHNILATYNNINTRLYCSRVWGFHWLIETGYLNSHYNHKDISHIRTKPIIISRYLEIEHRLGQIALINFSV